VTARPDAHSDIAGCEMGLNWRVKLRHAVATAMTISPPTDEKNPVTQILLGCCASCTSLRTSTGHSARPRRLQQRFSHKTRSGLVCLPSPTLPGVSDIGGWPQRSPRRRRTLIACAPLGRPDRPDGMATGLFTLLLARLYWDSVKADLPGRHDAMSRWFPLKNGVPGLPCTRPAGTIAPAPCHGHRARRRWRAVLCVMPGLTPFFQRKPGRHRRRAPGVAPHENPVQPSRSK